MNIDRCKADIKRHEGEVLEIYKDSLGFKTLGVGHLCQPQDPEFEWKEGTPVSQKIVDRYYMIDFDRHYAEAINVFGDQEAFYKLPESIQHVLVNMCFNLGGTGLSLFKNMLKACRAHDWKQMSYEMQNSKWFNQVGRRSVELQQTVIDAPVH